MRRTWIAGVSRVVYCTLYIFTLEKYTDQRRQSEDRGERKKVSDFASGFTTNDPTSIHITRGRECRQLLPSSSVFIPKLRTFLSWSACLVQDTISLAESECEERWGGESLFVWEINADSRDLPPFSLLLAWHPGQVGYVCINKHLPPPPSLRPGPNRRMGRDRREKK